MPHDHLVKEAIIIGIKDKLRECKQALQRNDDMRNQLLKERRTIESRMQKLENFRKDI
tara:strand:- start:1517 stop:1690 length:174 start_codon:yes stop_codon:yes gene_type:complete